MNTNANPSDDGGSRRAGFSLVEVIIAVVILAVGVLGLAGTTAYIVRQITLADLMTERAAARQTAIEKVNATPFAQLASGSDSVGVFFVEWTISGGGRSADVTVVTTGPGLSTSDSNPYPTLGPGVADTFEFTVVN